MTRLEARGIKRTCQNNECGLRFYDLNRFDCPCPNCGAAFDSSVGSQVAAAISRPQKFPARSKPFGLSHARRIPTVTTPAQSETGDQADEQQDVTSEADTILELDTDPVEDLDAEMPLDLETEH
jgi:hypothetical protein